MNGRGAVWLRWLLLYAVTTVVVSRLAYVPNIRVAHGVLVYLMLIIGASRDGGRALAAVMVALGYLAVDYFFVPPRGAIGNPSRFDLVILVGFVVTATVISQLVLSLRQTASVATARAAEIERLGVERLELERQAARASVLQDAERLKDALLASLSHDLRSPISAMTLLTDPASGIAPVAALPRLREQVGRLDTFLATLGRFTTAGDVGSMLHLSAQPVDALVRATVAAVGFPGIDHRITVHAPDEGMGLVATYDLTLSTQILGNLLQNAARYAPASAPIEIATERDATWIRITVSDRGPGIDVADVGHVFRPLWRGTVAASVTPGTGMGLAIARTFARAQGGDVRYRPRDGGGAHFDLLLPAEVPAGPTVG